MRPLPTLFGLILLFPLGEGLLAQPRYWIAFTDKDQTPYSVDQPSDFLSAEAIDRRERHGIPIDGKDLPVDPQYRDSILDHPEVELLHSSNWFNAISVESADSLHMDTIANLGFVKEKRRVRELRVPEEALPEMYEEGRVKSMDEEEWHGRSPDPGEATRQLAMLGMDHLHELGHRGKGVRIAVLDAGFPGVDEMEAFNHIFQDGRYIGGFDAVEGHDFPFHSFSHGRSVLSILAGVKEGEFLGSAPEASYILCRTEEVGSEFRVEEHNWIAAAEFADSAGADILSTSLGYTTFDDSSMNYSPSDMDGGTTMITRGADLAASRGILVVNSAGNYGNSSWGIIGAPADGDSVLSVGAVNKDGELASFSSRGPTADGRIKPDVVAMGEGTAYIGSDEDVLNGNGTSFSAPLISGGIASLWSAHPQLSPMELFERVLQNSDRHENPDNDYGHGIPDFYGLHLEEKGIEQVNSGRARVLSYGPNPFNKKLRLHIYSGKASSVRLNWWDMRGRKVRSSEHPLHTDHHRIVDLSGKELPSTSGLHVLELSWGDGRTERIELMCGRRN